MATFVMVHGAFGGGWQCREVARLLHDRGHEVHTPSLTGHGWSGRLQSEDTAHDLPMRFCGYISTISSTAPSRSSIIPADQDSENACSPSIARTFATAM